MPSASSAPSLPAVRPTTTDSDTFVADNYEQLRERQLFSAMVPKELGGGGCSHAEMCALVQELAEHCSSTGLAFSMHQHLLAAALFNHRLGRPGEKLLRKVAENEAVLVSTGANDWLASSGSVTRGEGGFRVTAKKPFASGSPAGHVLVTSAPYEDPQEGWQVLHFPVALSGDGVGLEENWRAMGMRGTGSNTVVLEDVFVPDEAIVLRRPRGAYHGVWNVRADRGHATHLRRLRGGGDGPRLGWCVSRPLSVATTASGRCWSVRWRPSWPRRRSPTRAWCASANESRFHPRPSSWPTLS